MDPAAVIVPVVINDNPGAAGVAATRYDQVLVPVFTSDAYSFMASAVIVPAIVTPPAAVGVQAPEPRLIMFTRVPIGKATLELVGMVMVLAVLTACVMFLPASVRTNV